jgi:hypothetical protein
VPIRNYEAFPTQRPMFAYSSIWAAEEWATQGGRIKTDWSKAPFVANYYDICECYNYGGCSTSCLSAAAPYTGACQLSQAELGQMQWVQGTHRIYDYCVDPKQWDNGQSPVTCHNTNKKSPAKCQYILLLLLFFPFLMMNSYHFFLHIHIVPFVVYFCILPHILMLGM